VLALLARRSDLRVVQLPMMESVAWALEGLPASLIVMGPELRSDLIAELFATIERLRPGVPVLALRSKLDEDLPTSSKRQLSVLAQPYAAPVLLHLVDMALGSSLPCASTAGVSVKRN
jgi:hypothetical protein